LGGDAHFGRPGFAFSYAAASLTMGKLLENKKLEDWEKF